MLLLTLLHVEVYFSSSQSFKVWSEFLTDSLFSLWEFRLLSVFFSNFRGDPRIRRDLPTSFEWDVLIRRILHKFEVLLYLASVRIIVEICFLVISKKTKKKKKKKNIFFIDSQSSFSYKSTLKPDVPNWWRYKLHAYLRTSRNDAKSS